MKGLLIKDIKEVWKVVIISMILMFWEPELFEEFGMDASKDIASIIAIAGWLIVLCGSAISAMLLADDDRSGFIKYAKIFPIRRSLVIGEKYIVSTLLIVLYTLIGTWNIYYIYEEDPVNIWWIVCIILPIALVINGILLLFITKFGTEKSIVIATVTFIIKISTCLTSVENIFPTNALTLF